MIRKPNGSDYYKVVVEEGGLSFADILDGASPKDVGSRFILAPHWAGAAMLSGKGHARLRSRQSDVVELRWPPTSPSKMILTAALMCVAAVSVVHVVSAFGRQSGFDLLTSVFMSMVFAWILAWLGLRLATELACPARCSLIQPHSGSLRMSCRKQALHWPHIGISEVDCDCDAIVVLSYEKPHMKKLPFYRGEPVQYVAFLASSSGEVFQIAESRSESKIAQVTSGLIGSSSVLAGLPLVNRSEDVSLIVGEAPIWFGSGD